MGQVLFTFLLVIMFGGQLKATYSQLDDDPSFAPTSKADLVIFSYDRPMQLYALLESCERYLQGLGRVSVILRYSTDDHLAAYEKVQKRFSFITLYKQLPTTRPDDFKKLLFRAIYTKKSPAKYVLFAVDDLLVTDFVTIPKCIKAMKKKRTWCFSLRLGQNIHLDTVRNIPSPPPRSKKVGKNMMAWRFADGAGSWNYPNSLDLTIYKKKSIRYFFKHARYSNPNTLEGAWSLHAPKSKRGLSFRHSKAVNIPLNVVNPFWSSNNMQISTDQLLEKFEEGLKIDINQFANLRPYSTHMPLTVSYIDRDDPQTNEEVSLTRSNYFLFSKKK